MTELKEIHSKALIEELEKKTTEHNQKLVELETSLKQKHSTEIENLKNEHDFFVNVIKEEYSNQSNGMSEVKQNFIFCFVFLLSNLNNCFVLKNRNQQNYSRKFPT
jgi:hypothetical protein